MDQLFSMRVFGEIARHGSFSTAARQLRISASVATRALRQLEERLGVELIQRTTRASRLTEPGREYLERIQHVLADLDDAERKVRGETSEPRGELVVAAPTVFGRLHVLPIVETLLARHPSLTARLVLSDRNAHLVDEGIDVAVRIGALDDSSLIAVRVGAVRRLTVASPGYLSKHGTPTTLTQLGKHALISFAPFDGGHWHFSERAGTIRIAPRLSLDNVDAMLAATEAGVGIARALSYQVASAVKAKRLVTVLDRFAPAEVPVSVIYPGRRSASANVSAFVREARASLAITERRR